jgi:hypothetical protein
MSLDEIEIAKLRWETKEEFRLANLPPWEQPDAKEHPCDTPEEEDSSQVPESEDEEEDDRERFRYDGPNMPLSYGVPVKENDEELAVYIGGDCV